MAVYLIMMIFALGVTYFVYRTKFVIGNKSIEYLKIIIVSMPFILVSGLRAETIGLDYQAYTVSYYNFGSLSRGREWEVLGTLIIKIANYLKSPTIIIWFYTLTFCIGTIYWIERQSDNWIYSVLLFGLTGFFNWSLNIMRQSTATIIVYITLEQFIKERVEKKDQIFFLISIVIASMFHKLSAVYLILLIFPYKLFEKKLKLLVILLPFLPLISAWAREIIMFISQRFNFFYRYFNNFYDQGTYTGSLILASLLCLSVTLITYKKWKNQTTNKYRVLAAVQYLAVVLSLIANVIPNNARVTYEFFPISIVALPQFTNLINSRYRKIVICISIVVLSLYYINSFVIGNWGETIPFKWVFQ